MSETQATGILALGDTLLEIDEGKFRQVVGLLEHMGDHPDVLRTFSMIRPRLAELRPKRRPTLKRLFCDPFEDLFDPLLPDEKTPVNTIERAVINHLWPLVEEQLGSDTLAAFTASHRDAVDSGNAAALSEVAEAFWATSAEAVRTIAALLETGRLTEAMDLRINPERMRAVQDIATALSIAPALAGLKRALAPKPLAKLHHDHLDEVQEIGRKLAKADGPALKVFVLVAAARLADPSLLLGALWHMDFGQKSSDRATLFAELSGSVVSQIEDRARVLGAGKPGAADRLAVADLAAGLVASLDATRKAMEVSRRSEFDQRLKQVRGAVHEMVRTQLLAGAETDILGTVGATTGKEEVKQAENHARALRKCATIADSLGLRTELRQVTEKTVSALTGAAQQVFGGSPEAAADPRAGYAAIRMIELISGPVEANRILGEILDRARLV
ncbi:MAG TPA: hypothetical protein VD995_10695 [Azospirillum sp.]|nr:hypothetical protein [Azospirillum sp.]